VILRAAVTLVSFGAWLGPAMAQPGPHRITRDKIATAGRPNRIRTPRGST
jgi:hypothetical protein